MKILLISPNLDPAGVSYLLFRAINEHTEHECRQFATKESYLLHGRDMSPENCTKEDFLKLVEESDILHYNCTMEDVMGVDWKEFVEEKGIVLHTHGEFLLDVENGGADWRRQAESKKYFYTCANKGVDRIFTCSAVETFLYDNSAYMPNILPINDELYKPLENKDMTQITVWFSPTGHRRLQAQTLLDVIQKVKGVYNNVFAEIIMDVSRDTCMERRRKTQLSFDGMVTGYQGMSGYEALSQGIPTMVRQDEVTIDALEEIAGAKTPFINVSTKDEMACVISKFCEDTDALKEASISARKWMEKYWNEEKLVKRYIDEYEKILK